MEHALRYFNRRCKVYDVDKKEVIAEFESIMKASQFLGLTAGQVRYMLEKKKRNQTNKLGKTITVREIP